VGEPPPHAAANKTRDRATSKNVIEVRTRTVVLTVNRKCKVKNLALHLFSAVLGYWGLIHWPRLSRLGGLPDAASPSHFPNRFQFSGPHGEQVGVKMDCGVVVGGDQFDLVAGPQLTTVAVG